jgi:tyrosyl-tRNA synthetase
MSTEPDFVADLHARGLVAQTTATGVEEAAAKGSLTGYIGFDPTAPSLHVGSLLPVTLLMRLQRAGHRPIALVGGGTGLIGDPSGKDDERQLLTVEKLEENSVAMRAQLEHFLDFSGERGALMLNNLEWLGELNLIEFLRDVGKYFSVNSMIARESVKRRLEGREHGISYTEFSYSLLQAYDFLELFDRHDCTLQMGGSDQWGNIVAGADLIRRERQVEVHGVTSHLISRSDGKKFGKSEQGNVWLDPEQTTPFEFYQFWINTPDADVESYLKYFTFLAVDEIEAACRAAADRPEAREAQRLLAAEVTRMVHGDESLARVEKVTRVLFSGGDLRELDAAGLGQAFKDTPRTAVTAGELADGVALTEGLVRAGLAPSKGRARNDIGSGAISINHIGEKDVHRRLGSEDLLAGTYIVLRRGKKTYGLIEVTGAGAS